jgi:hypothetical protein
MEFEQPNPAMAKATTTAGSAMTTDMWNHNILPLLLY